MSLQEELLAFVHAAKDRGVSDSEVLALLRQHGWSERRVYGALSAYYRERVGPIPERGGSAENARAAFVYLLAFVTLGIWAVALVWLAGALIDRALPSPIDSAGPATSFRNQVAGQIASLIVAFPIFLIVSRQIVRETAIRPESVESGVRKWLTYIALVITSVILLGDGVWFLDQFLLGELTLRFTLKAMTVFAVAGGILWYYLGTVRSTQAKRPNDATFAWTACAIVGVAIVLGFTGIGSPSYNRSVAFDEQRIANLQSIADVARASYVSNPKLPPSLQALTQDEPQVARDPVTRAKYEYKVIGGGAYRLCAIFDTDSRSQTGDRISFWRHPAGRHCFDLSARQSPGN